MKTNKFNKMFNRYMLVASILSIIATFFLEPYRSLEITDFLFILVLIVLLTLLIFWKQELHNKTLLFYNFILISSLFIYDLKITLSIVIGSMLLSAFVYYFYGKKNYFIVNTSVLSEGLIIILCLFLSKGAFMVFSQVIKDAPMLLVQIIILNLFYHIFHNLLSSLEYLFDLSEIKYSNLLDDTFSILINFLYSTTFTYLGLILYTLLNHLPILLLFIFNTLLLYFYIKSDKEKYMNSYLTNLKEANMASLSVNYNIISKIFIYLDVMNKIIPSSILGIYTIFDNYTSILPLCHKCEDNIHLNTLCFNTEKMDNFIQMIESGRPIILDGYKIKDYFNFIPKFDLYNSKFIISPITLYSKVIGFSLIHPKYYNYSTDCFNILVDIQKCLSLLIEQNYKIINNIPKAIDTSKHFEASLESLVNNKITFTISKIETDDIGTLYKDISYRMDKLDKIFIFNDRNIYILHPLKDSFNVSNWFDSLKLNTKNNNVTSLEYPTDINNLKDLFNKTFYI